MRCRGRIGPGLLLAAWVLVTACTTLGAADKPDTAPAPAAVPDAADVARADKAVAELFKAELAAKDPAGRALLAERFRKQAAEGGDDAATRYVLLRRACDLAAEGNDYAAAFATVEELAAAFRVDADGVKLETLTKAATGARSPAAAVALTTAACDLGETFAARGDTDAAAKASSVATTASHRARDADAVARAKLLARRISQAKAEEKQYQAASRTLDRNPDDPRANLVAGRHLCFSLGDWAAGAPLLARSSEPQLKALATRELAKPADPDAMVALGDAWWELPDNRGGVTQAQARQRAAYWYAKALPDLKGLKRIPVEARVVEERLAREARLPRLALERLVVANAHDERTTLTSEGLVLKPVTQARTPDELAVPVRIDVIAKVEKNNLRLYFGEKGELIFNWELNNRELRYHDPATGRHHGVANQGSLEPGRWATITWLIEPRRATVLVDGKRRATFEGDYGNLRGTAGIGAVDSVVTVKSWRFAPAGTRAE